MSFYIISDPSHMKDDLYKFGITNDVEYMLKFKYKKYLCNAKVLLFYKSNDCVKDEITIMKHFKNVRCIDYDGTRSKWIKINYEELKKYLDFYFGKSIVC